MNFTEAKNKALSFVRLAHESDIPCFVCIRDADLTIVDATGGPEDLGRMLLYAVDHCIRAMPDPELATEFARSIAEATQALSERHNKLPRREGGKA